MKRSGYQASHARSGAVVETALRAGQGALSAVISGFFAAAGAEPGVLLAPLTLVVAGLGSGTFVYDGRCRQPGRGIKRPRGFVSEEDVASAARAAVPKSMAALALACAFHPSSSLLACSRAGVIEARAAGCRRRAEAIDLFAGLGASALSAAAFKQQLIAQFGPVQQGLISAEDLSYQPQLQARLQALPGQSAIVAPAPELVQGAAGPISDALGIGHALIAVDAQGLFAALSFRALPDTLPVEGWELSMPPLASPVMRGETRVSPGQVLACPSELWVELGEGGKPRAVAARANRGATEMRLERDPVSLEISQPPHAPPLP